MEVLKNYLDKICIPSCDQAIYKDECVYSYDTPETSTGLYVSLSTFLGFGKEYVLKYAEKTGNNVFLHIHRQKILKQKKEQELKQDDNIVAAPECKITRLAIGIEGGYNDASKDLYDYKDIYNIVIMPSIDVKIPYPNNDLPLIVQECVQAILAEESALKKIEKETVSGTWDGEIRQISKYSENLVQLNNNKKIPPSGWKCEKCDLKTNLWLNLSDGAILCGRKFFDGSGGNDHAVQHYQEFGYPLAVKLGTITADGKSDVFSYPEDDMVIDTKLEEHLAHFGINMSSMKKSEKSMVELELEINQRIGEWSLLTESDSQLHPLCGSGYTGIRNLGNSCYINSVMQVLFSIPDFIKRYTGDGAESYFTKYPKDPANDFNIQMSKLGNGLWSGKYSSISENTLDTTGISPVMFKNVVGKGHPDFSTRQQQDAFDFYLHIINLLKRHLRNDVNPPPFEALTFALEERVECMASKKVKYTRRDEYCLPLLIPLEKATNLDEVKKYLEEKSTTAASKTKDDIIRYKIPLEACLERFFASEIIENFYSTAIQGITTAKKIVRLVNMPEYLMMHLRKFTLGDDWSPKKLDVSIQMPDELNMSQWRIMPRQPGEEELCDDNKSVENKVFKFDESILNSLMQMGFPQEACKRAIFNTKNGGIEVASNWLMEHIDDSDFSEPFIIPATMDTTQNANIVKQQNSYVPNPESLAVLISMGFNTSQATKALQATNGALDRATDWIFSHMDDMDVEDAIAEATAVQDDARGQFENQKKPLTKAYRDGSSKYQLIAFISHMGTSAQVGHYVCHIKRNGQWVIFNDTKVALSQNPPKDLGYLYLYKRV